jgi:hypothetical protein
MSNGEISIGGDGFEEALAELVHEAVLGGIEVQGGWDLRGEDGNPDFTVEIYRLDG